MEADAAALTSEIDGSREQKREVLADIVEVERQVCLLRPMLSKPCCNCALCFNCHIDGVLFVDGALCGCLPPTKETGI
jgi:hypothetical protein